MYNEILVIPLFGLNHNTKVALAARAEEEGIDGAKEDVNANYMATSPHATYDANRNKRLLAKVAREEEEELRRDDDQAFVLNTSTNAKSELGGSASDLRGDL